MGNQALDVKVDKNSVLAAVSKLEQIGDGQSAMAGSLTDVDKDLFANWEGEAGDKFEMTATYLETVLAEIAKKNAKYSGALVDLSQ